MANTKLLALFFICLSTVCEISSDVPGLDKCYDRKCPVGTYLCKKYTHVSKDKKRLEIDISCLDKEKRQLDKFHEETENPYSHDVHFEGYSFTGIYYGEANTAIGNKQPTSDTYKNSNE